ncbi:MAG: MotA/TolQ/ExbB proton channel family protein, partial [Proteobacteria bacterium]|nr:MotA/TolQ/ExbB proton channel family protein [Pseudomonadota bacterium]
GGVWEQILAGGILVWPILGLGLLALLLGLERLVSLWRHSTRVDVLLCQVIDLIHNGQITEAKRLANHTRGAAARVLARGLENAHLEQKKLKDVLSEALSRELPRLERFLPILAVIAAVAPLLGLLGTVTGMISTFEVITEHGTGDPKMLSGGISVALVTTQLGLAVAIPVLLFHALLSGMVDKMVSDMTRVALTLNNALHGVEFVRQADSTLVPHRCVHESCRFDELAAGQGGER